MKILRVPPIHRRVLFCLAAAALHLPCLAPLASAQTFDFKNVRLHGYATQGLLYTTHNDWATTASSDGTPAFTEAVANLTAQPLPRLRIGAQARYFLLGDYGNKVTLDWAQADYKVSELFGIRGGKVKAPTGLFNEIQDIDPAFLWILLPQSVYPLPSRNANLALYGGSVYGNIPMGEALGKLEYHGFGGQRVVGGDDGYLQAPRDGGLTVPNGVSGPTFGASLRWNLPVTGLLVGASEAAGGVGGEFDLGPIRGSASSPQQRQTYYFGKYDHGRILVAGEFSRLQFLSLIAFPGYPTRHLADTHAFYAMTSYRATGKLSTGLYYSSSIDKEVLASAARYQKDWTLAARYDFNPFLYAKLEQHFIDGTELNYSALDNPNLQPNTRMTLLKLGVSF